MLTVALGGKGSSEVLRGPCDKGRAGSLWIKPPDLACYLTIIILSCMLCASHTQGHLLRSNLRHLFLVLGNLSSQNFIASSLSGTAASEAIFSLCVLTVLRWLFFPVRDWKCWCHLQNSVLPPVSWFPELALMPRPKPAASVGHGMRFNTKLLGSASSVSEHNWRHQDSGFVQSQLLQESLEKWFFSSCFPLTAFLASTHAFHTPSSRVYFRSSLSSPGSDHVPVYARELHTGRHSCYQDES